MGLAWTALGGSTLYVEAASIEKGEGKGGLRTTGAWMAAAGWMDGSQGCCQGAGQLG